VEARFTGQTIDSFLVIFLDIRSASVATIIIDAKIYERAFGYFVARVLEVRQKIAEKRAACDFTAEAPTSNPANQDQHQDDGAADFDSDEDVIVDVPVMNDKEDKALAMERDNCNLWINQPVDWTTFLTDISSKAKDEYLNKKLQTIHG
jgi:hypothetical protein